MVATASLSRTLKPEKNLKIVKRILVKSPICKQVLGFKKIAFGNNVDMQFSQWCALYTFLHQNRPRIIFSLDKRFFYPFFSFP